MCGRLTTHFLNKHFNTQPAHDRGLPPVLPAGVVTVLGTLTYSHCAEGKAPRNRMTTLVLIQICIETKQGWSAY